MLRTFELVSQLNQTSSAAFIATHFLSVVCKASGICSLILLWNSGDCSLRQSTVAFSETRLRLPGWTGGSNISKSAESDPSTRIYGSRLKCSCARPSRMRTLVGGVLMPLGRGPWMILWVGCRRNGASLRRKWRWSDH